jgi:YD repeat-containing protein
MRKPSARLRIRPRFRAVLAALSFGLPLLTASRAGASETLTYTYDARGRLTKVVHSGSVNNGVNYGDSLLNAPNRPRMTCAAALHFRLLTR